MPWVKFWMLTALLASWSCTLAGQTAPTKAATTEPFTSIPKGGGVIGFINFQDGLPSWMSYRVVLNSDVLEEYLTLLQLPRKGVEESFRKNNPGWTSPSIANMSKQVLAMAVCMSKRKAPDATPMVVLDFEVGPYAPVGNVTALVVARRQASIKALSLDAEETQSVRSILDRKLPGRTIHLDNAIEFELERDGMKVGDHFPSAISHGDSRYTGNCWMIVRESPCDLYGNSTREYELQKLPWNADKATHSDPDTTTVRRMLAGIGMVEFMTDRVYAKAVEIFVPTLSLAWFNLDRELVETIPLARKRILESGPEDARTAKKAAGYLASLFPSDEKVFEHLVDGETGEMQNKGSLSKYLSALSGELKSYQWRWAEQTQYQGVLVRSTKD